MSDNRLLSGADIDGHADIRAVMKRGVFFEFIDENGLGIRRPQRGGTDEGQDQGDRQGAAVSRHLRIFLVLMKMGESLAALVMSNRHCAGGIVSCRTGADRVAVRAESRNREATASRRCTMPSPGTSLRRFALFA